jgi:hypothetical protein
MRNFTPNEMYAVVVDAAKHMTFAPGVFRSSGIIAYTTNVAIRKMEEAMVVAMQKIISLKKIPSILSSMQIRVLFT